MHGGTHDLCARSSLRVSRRPLFRRYRSGFRLDPDAVVDRRGNPLRAAKVAFGGLHGNVTKQELNLLQLAACGSTKPGAASTEIMRRELADADLGSELLDDVPDEFFRHPFAPNFASTTHAAEEAASGDSGGLRPLVKQTLHPIRNRNGSNVPSLPAKVHDCPMSFALLKVAYCQPCEFVTTEPTSKKYCKQGPIPFSPDPVAIWSLPESLALVGS